MNVSTSCSITEIQKFAFAPPIQTIINNLGKNDQIIIKIAENLQTIKRIPPQIPFPSNQRKFITKNMQMASEIYFFFKSASQVPLKENLKSILYDAIEKKVNADLQLNELVSLTYMLDYLDFAPDSSKEGMYTKLMAKLDSKIEYNKEYLSDCVWATFALRKVKVEDKKYLFDRFRSIIQAYHRNLTPFETSLAIRGFKTAKLESSALLSSLRHLTINRNLDINQIVYTLRAFSPTKHDTRIDSGLKLQLIQFFKPTLIQKMDELSIKQTIRISRIFSEMNIIDINLFNSIRNKLDKHLNLLTTKELTYIAKALFNTDRNNDAILLKILDTVEMKLDESEASFDMWELSKITYAALIKFCKNDENFNVYSRFIHNMLVRFSKSIDTSWDEESLFRLRTIAEIYNETFKNSNQGMMVSLQHLISSIQPFNDSPVSSQLHLDVRDHLEKFLYDIESSLNMENEYPFFGFSLDIAFCNEKLAIEIDGHCHFDENGEYMPKNILKETLLKLKGWSLVRIKHSEWPGTSTGQWTGFDQEKRDILSSKLEQLLIPEEIYLYEDQENEEFEENSKYDNPDSEGFWVAQENIDYDLRERSKPKHFKKLLQRFEKNLVS